MKRPSTVDFDEWSSLSRSAREIIDGIRNKWLRLIHKPAIREQVIHRFLENHAHLLFRDSFNFCTVISKLRFGADHICDFVVVYDRWSAGVEYCLVEIERPDTPPFTQEGIASARLSRAIQQVLSWQSWLADHSVEAQRLFPSQFLRTKKKTAFSFLILIGTRGNSEKWIDRRNVLAQSLGVSIRSFTSFADRLERRHSYPDFSKVGDEVYSLGPQERNRLACPFFKALSDRDWRFLLGRCPADSHFMHNFGAGLLALRRETRAAQQFRKLQAKR